MAKTEIIIRTIGALLLAGVMFPALNYKPFSYHRPDSTFAQWGRA